MLRERLGDDQTIDLGQWALCLGIQRRYLDTVPGLQCAAHVIVVDDRWTVQEVLRIAVNGWTLRLSFLP